MSKAASVIAAYRARLEEAERQVGTPEIRTADVDGLTLAVSEMESVQTSDQASSKAGEYKAQRDQAVTDGDKATARGLFWVIMGLNRLAIELKEPAHV